MINPIYFRDISESDFRFVYELLKDRPQTAHLSERVPSEEESNKFNAGSPYLKDMIIYEFGGTPIGRVILDRDNSIGIDIKREFIGLGYGKAAMEQFLGMLGEGTYFANISIDNTRSLDFFKRLGFEPFKVVYRKEL